MLRPGHTQSREREGSWTLKLGDGAWQTVNVPVLPQNVGWTGGQLTTRHSEKYPHLINHCQSGLYQIVAMELETQTFGLDTDGKYVFYLKVLSFPINHVFNFSNMARPTAQTQHCVGWMYCFFIPKPALFSIFFEWTKQHLTNLLSSFSFLSWL